MSASGQASPADLEREPWNPAEQNRRLLTSAAGALRDIGAIVTDTWYRDFPALLVDLPHRAAAMTSARRTIVVVLHDDHWVAGLHDLNAFLRYLGDLYLPPPLIAEAVRELAGQ